MGGTWPRGQQEMRPAAASSLPSTGMLAFRMIRHASEMGRQTLTFERQGDTLTVRVVADVLVEIACLPVDGLLSKDQWNGALAYPKARAPSEVAALADVPEKGLSSLIQG